MANILNELLGDEPGATKKNYSLLKEDSENGGYFEKDRLLADLRKAKASRPSFLSHTNILFEQMQLKRELRQAPQKAIESGWEVWWCRFKYGNTAVNLCVPSISGISELLDDYEHGRVVIETSFEELLKRAAGEV